VEPQETQRSGARPSDDLTAAGARTSATLEPLHSMIYFAPEVGEELGPAGIEHPRAQYFAQRAAALGAVGPGLVAATFYNFNPALVARFVPLVWASARPADVINLRYRAADAALRRLLGGLVSSREVADAGALLRRALEGAPAEDRPLYAAHADVPWPDEPHLALWHGVTLLREHRGDGHLHALASAGLSGIEALVTHTATGRGFLPETARASRGWSTEQWGDAVAGLREAGLVTAGELALTPAGEAQRREVEDHTGRLAAGPWRRLGAEGTARLRELAAPLAAAVAEAGAFPDGVFAPGSARARRSSTPAP
jgi:hypothetical protein